MGNPKPFAAVQNLSVRRLRIAGAQVLPGRCEDRGAGPFPALSHRVYLGGDLLCGQPANFIPDAEAGDRGPALWRVRLGDDELRSGAAFGHPSLAAQV